MQHVSFQTPQQKNPVAIIFLEFKQQKKSRHQKDRKNKASNSLTLWKCPHPLKYFLGCADATRSQQHSKSGLNPNKTTRPMIVRPEGLQKQQSKSSPKHDGPKAKGQRKESNQKVTQSIPKKATKKAKKKANQPKERAKVTYQKNHLSRL